MWCDHEFSQRNRTAERTVGVCLKVTREWEERGVWTKFKKKGVVFIK